MQTTTKNVITFNGTGSAEVFIRKFESQVAIKGWGEAHKARAFIGALSGTAQAVYRHGANVKRIQDLIQEWEDHEKLVKNSARVATQERTTYRSPSRRCDDSYLLFSIYTHTYA